MNMTPETEYLLAYGRLEAIGKGEGNDHHRYADNGSRNRKPDNKPGK